MAGGWPDASGSAGWVAAAQSLGRASPKRHRSVTGLGVTPKLSGWGGSRLHVVIPDNTRRHMAVDIRTFMPEADRLDGLVALGTRTAQATLVAG